MRYPLKPYVLGMRVTDRCNVGCFHCALSATPVGADIPLSRAARAIEQAAAWGIRLLHISGGEPLLHKHLAAIVSEGRNAGMFVEMVSSTHSTAEGEADDLRLLRKAAQAGLGRVLLSYDDGHARRVEFARFARFAVEARDLGLEICIYGLEASHFSITLEQIRSELIEVGFDPAAADWVAAMYSHTGRGAAVTPAPSGPSPARCPYIMPVPTLAPDGRLLLCPCAILRAPNFVLGHQDTDGLGPILDRFQRSSFHRFLALHGPHEALRRLGESPQSIPVEICEACDRYLQMGEESVAGRVSPTELDGVLVDLEALLPPHRRFLEEFHGDRAARERGAG